MDRIGLIGAGVVGKMRARVLGSRLVAVADPDRQAAQSLGANTYTDYRELLEHPGLQAVVVATPAHLHRDMVEAALKAGLHVLCEKPLATSSEECRVLVELAESCGLVLATGFNHRYYPFSHRFRQVLPQLGPIDHVRALCGHRGLPEFRAHWMYESRYSGGGAMMDIGIHLTDLVHHFFGPITSLYGSTSNRLWQVEGSEDQATATFHTERGVTVAYHANWGEWKGYRFMLEAYGHNGVARAFYAPMVNLSVARSQGRPPFRWDFHPWVNVREKLFGWETTAILAFAEEFEDFLGAVEGRWGHLADGRAGLHAVEVAEAVYRSSESGRVVDLSQTSREG